GRDGHTQHAVPERLGHPRAVPAALLGAARAARAGARDPRVLGRLRPPRPAKDPAGATMTAAASMFDLSAPIQFVKGVGPERAKALAGEGLATVEDLLFRLPMRYEDRRALTRIADLRPGMKTAVAGTVAAAGLRRTRRMPLYEIALQDESGRL